MRRSAAINRRPYSTSPLANFYPSIANSGNAAIKKIADRINKSFHANEKYITTITPGLPQTFHLLPAAVSQLSSAMPGRRRRVKSYITLPLAILLPDTHESFRKRKRKSREMGNICRVGDEMNRKGRFPRGIARNVQDESETRVESSGLELGGKDEASAIKSAPPRWTEENRGTTRERKKILFRPLLDRLHARVVTCIRVGNIS